MPVASKKIVVELTARLTCDLVTEEFKVFDAGVERDPTPAETFKIMNGWMLVMLRPVA